MQSKQVRKWSQVTPDEAGTLVTKTISQTKKPRRKAPPVLRVSAPESASSSSFSSSPITPPSSSPSTPSPRPTSSTKVDAKAYLSKFRVKVNHPASPAKNSTSGEPIQQQWTYNVNGARAADGTGATVEARMSYRRAEISDSSGAEAQRDENSLGLLDFSEEAGHQDPAGR